MKFRTAWGLVIIVLSISIVGAQDKPKLTTEEQLKKVQEELTISQKELASALGELHRTQVKMLEVERELLRYKQVTLSIDRERLTPLMISTNGGDPKVDGWDWTTNTLIKKGKP